LNPEGSHFGKEALGMLWRSLFAALLLLAAVRSAAGQAAASPGDSSQGAWRSSGDRVAGSAAVTPAVQTTNGTSPVHPGEAVTPIARHLAQVTTGSGTLPNQHGQQWREYDISPYTLRVTSTNRPEQAVVDWILRETGYEAWHAEPLGILTATNRKLLVYHTPEMQELVADVVDRFVNTEAAEHGFALRVVTVNHPNWRERAYRMLKPVQVQTAGVHAWLLQKEDAAVLLAELQRRADYREHSTPQLQVYNGQSTVVSATRPKSYIRNVSFRPNAWPGYEPETAVIDEGYSLEFSPLLSVDGRAIDAMIRCEIDQVEKMVPVMIDVPTAAAPRQRTQIEIPQMAEFRFHERFRWPVDQVLLVGMGMVAAPVPTEGKSLVPGIPLPLPTSPARADLLVFVESKGTAGDGSPVAQRQAAGSRATTGR
jgi:hypothetical protein